MSDETAKEATGGENEESQAAIAEKKPDVIEVFSLVYQTVMKLLENGEKTVSMCKTARIQVWILWMVYFCLARSISMSLTASLFSTTEMLMTLTSYRPTNMTQSF